MADLNRIADLLMPGLRTQQLRLEEVSAYLDQLVATLRLNADKNEWLPIETAPKDGTNILIYTTGRFWRGKWSDEIMDGFNDDPEVMEAAWQPWYNHEMEGWMPVNLDEEYGRFYEASHWMPLPKPPVMEDDNDQWPLADDK